MAALASALRFLEAFPEATAYTVVLARSDTKEARVSRPQCSGEELRKNLGDWLKMPGVHFFIRPLMANLVMLDLDDFQFELDLNP